MQRSRPFNRNDHHSRHHRRSPSPGLPSRKKLAHRSRHDTHRGGETNDRSYVESWLQQTSALEVAAHVGDVGGSRLKSATTARGYGDTGATDSSIIHHPSPQPRERASHHHNSKTHGELVHHSQKQPRTERKRRRASPSSSAESEISDRSVPVKVRYEKRARHKTREDKYEPGHGGPARPKVTEDKPARSRTKEKDNKGDKKKKRGLTTSKELMGRFSSDAIHSDRLTMLPSMQMGIFGNSKLDKAPGDLTFGDMGFLKEPKAQEPEKIASKSRSTESKKRDQQELENISVFFSHKKHDAGRPTKMRKTTEHQTVARHSTVAPSLHGLVKDRSRASTPGKATSYISWSSSHNPAERQSEQRVELPRGSPTEERLTERLAEKRASSSRVPTPTPDSIRRMLRDSGLYRFQSSGRSERAHQKPQLNQQENQSPRQKRQGYPKEDTPSERPLSRGFVAQQAYIKPKKVIPRVPPVEVALHSKEVPPSPKLPTVVQSALRPTLFEHGPLSQDPSPKPKTLDALRHQRQISPPVHERQQKEAPSRERPRYTVPSMIPRPENGAFVARQPLRQQPALSTSVAHFNPRQDVQQPSRAESIHSYLHPFRPLSVLSSRPSLPSLGGRPAPYDCQSNQSPYQRVSFRQAVQAPSSIHGPTHMTGARPSWEITRPEVTRQSRMLDYINQLERDILGGHHDEEDDPTSPNIDRAQETNNGREAYGGEAFSPALESFYPSATRFDADQQVSWEESQERYDYAYTGSRLAPRRYANQEYEGVGAEQIDADERPWPDQRPPRPGTAMGGNTDGVAMYWKPNTCGL